MYFSLFLSLFFLPRVQSRQLNYKLNLLKYQHYSNFLTEPLEILEDWVVELFSKVKESTQVNNIVENCPVPFWKSGKLYRLEAVKDLHTLHLSWTLPCLKKEYLKKPEDYICHLLGHGYYPPFCVNYCSLLEGAV